MKFMTENDLREQFKNMTVKVYEAAPDVRLTPGARQFLIDRGIDLYHSEEKNPSSTARQSQGMVSALQQDAKLASINAFILESIWELGRGDEAAAKSLRELYHWLGECMENQCVNQSLCLPCNGMKPGTYCEAKPDCFPVDESVSCGVGETVCRTVLRLHRIRCSLRELPETTLVNEAINKVSQMICAALGGGKCKTK